MKGKPKLQIAKIIFFKHKNTLKKLLQMGEFKFGGRKSQEYKFFKKNCSDYVYEQLKQILKLLEIMKISEKCECGCSIEKREGTQPCLSCGGSGYKNTECFVEMLAKMDGWDDDPVKMLIKSIDIEKKQNEELTMPKKQEMNFSTMSAEDLGLVVDGHMPRLSIVAEVCQRQPKN